ncbi:hypothetical protein rosmuc_03029 [Roseovarius mucosus DSM 17069]|uniref:Uncharacterized protein n=1 Tax=Roseovarius mucosus DSM 17069 TaxID=1288298 RepID=A0A0A0HIH0_9RHOB|nr:hypothetical protein [Roseovarius mucosus]KGM86736.1 hypothetical protein rosmuc_03029 [Roseovarius mucosus DSM 17069]
MATENLLERTMTLDTEPPLTITVDEGIQIMEVALHMAVREMRKELRWMLEVGGNASANVPPKLDLLDATERQMINDVLEALRACILCTGRNRIDDGLPAWIDDVIARGQV